MKKLKETFFFKRRLKFIQVFILILMYGCESENISDNDPPGDILIVSIESTNGGAIINYELPSDNDILYVRAEYMNAQGQKVFRVSSKHKTSLEISGMIDSTPVDVSITVVDESFRQPQLYYCLLYTSPSPRDGLLSRMPSSA